MTLERALAALGISSSRLVPTGGGDTAATFLVTTESGTYFGKHPASPAPGMLTLEAAGLEWLREAGLRVPRVVAVSDDVLILELLPVRPPTAASARRFGAALANAHAIPAAAWGVAPAPGTDRGWVGAVPVSFGAWPSFPEFLVYGRLLPTLALARPGMSGPDIRVIEDACTTILATADLREGPGPGHCHGDLWSGNVVWLEDGAAVVDPSAHGGHPETDIAMLHLFGVPLLTDILAGYESHQALPLGWRDRLPLHQLFPLLVHAVMFGEPYGQRAGYSARAVLRAVTG